MNINNIVMWEILPSNADWDCTVGKKFQIGKAHSRAEKIGPFLSVYADDIKLAGKKQNIDPIWQVHMKEVDEGEPRSFLDHVCLGCTHEILWIITEACSNQGFLQEKNCQQQKPR